MKKIYNSIKMTALLFFVSAGLLNAQYANGVIIGNEGNFGQPNADVSYLDSQTFQLTNNVYTSVNNENLGDVLQNVGFNGDFAYLVCNNSNKVVVVDRETFVKQAVLTENVELPRYVGFANDKVYVTNSGSSGVAVFNANDNSFVTHIGLGVSPEEIEGIGNHIFTQNGWFASGNTVSVIDATTDTVIETITLEGGMNGIEADNEFLYVLNTGAEYTHLYKINGATLEIVADTRFTNVVSSNKLALEDNILYFVGNGNKAYAIDTNLSSAPVEIFEVNNNSWSTFYGFNVINGYAFSGDANGFTAPSIVKVFNVENGQEVRTYNTTIGVNNFYANFGNLAVNDVAHNQIKVTTYPNPVVDFVNFSGVDAATVLVYNINGQQVKSIKYEGEALNVSDLNTGLYYFVIKTATGSITKKVLVK